MGFAQIERVNQRLSTRSFYRGSSAFEFVHLPCYQDNSFKIASQTYRRGTANAGAWPRHRVVAVLEDVDTLIMSPALSSNATLTYRQPLAGGDLMVNTNYHYQTRIYFDVANSVRQGGYGLLNMRAGWTTPGSHFTFSVYGKNLTNKAYINYTTIQSLAYQSLWAEPLEVGGQIDFKF